MGLDSLFDDIEPMAGVIADKVLRASATGSTHNLLPRLQQRGQAVATPFSKRILIVEDEFIIASTLQDTVLHLGHTCIGPAGTLAAALILAETSEFDAALINYVLGEETADPLCELLDRRRIPFAFATGLDLAGAGTRWDHKPRLQKPYPLEEVGRVIALLIPN